jgi:xanthine dehydrogenase accessory factor
MHRLKFVETLAELAGRGEPFVSVTLVKTAGSTPQDSGSKMLVNAHGLVYGTVGGGRVENQAIRYAQQMIQSPSGDATAFVEWNLKRDVRMTCGGSVALFFETYNHRTWRIVIFGAGHVAQALTRVLLQVECQVICVDPRAEWIERLPTSPRLTAVQLADVADYVTEIGDHDFVVCMTMGHATDQPILARLLRRDPQPAFVGVIGSRAKRQVLIQELVATGISEDNAGRFECPLGLELGSNHPGEIAVSIAASLIRAKDAISERKRVHKDDPS